MSAARLLVAHEMNGENSRPWAPWGLAVGGWAEKGVARPATAFGHGGGWVRPARPRDLGQTNLQPSITAADARADLPRSWPTFWPPGRSSGQYAETPPLTSSCGGRRCLLAGEEI